MAARDAQLEAAILDLLHQRADGKTLCPSEAARAVYGSLDDPEAMPQTRAAAARLVERGLIEVTQKGRAVDLGSARGPIRLRLRGR